MLNQVSNRVSKFRGRAADTALVKYRAAVTSKANSMHVAGHLVPLTDIVVTQRFYTPRPPYNPLDQEGVDLNPLSLIPLVPDFPEAFAPYELPGFGIKGLLQTSKRIALLGLPGSGRTTTLASIALQTATQVDVASSPEDLFDVPSLPLLANLNNLDFSKLAFDQEHSVLQPLIDAAQAEIKAISSRVSDMLVHTAALGNLVVLLDGWEELSATARLEVSEWLTVFTEQFPQAHVIVTGPVNGHQQLQDAGFNPVYMMPWGRVSHEMLVQKWREAWPLIGGLPEDPASIPDGNTVRRAERGLNGRSALDSTLKVWAVFSGAESMVRQVDWYASYMERVTAAPYLNQAIYQYAADILLSSEATGSYDRLLSAIDAQQASGGAQSVRTSDYVYSLLNESRILVQYSNGTVAFRHPTIQGYLAAQTIDVDVFQPELLDLPPRLVMPFVAQVQDITEYVDAHIGEEDDLLLDNILDPALWMPNAPTDAEWRTNLFKRFARLFLSGETFPLIRERVMAALVATLDVNTAFIFERGLQDSDPQVRLLSALGLGALGDPENVVLLGQAISDPDGGVEVAASLGLGAIGNKAALTYMLQMFVTGDEMARRAVAEMLSTNTNGEGHEILREALDEPDPLTRKATIYALERVDKPWVMEQLAESERHDGQFIIRSAATDILDRLRSGWVASGNKALKPEETEWIVAYYDKQNQEVRSGQPGLFQVIDILHSGNEGQQLAAAEMLGSLGAAVAIGPLYEALTIEHPEIRDSVYRALGAISIKIGEALPAVV